MEFMTKNSMHALLVTCCVFIIVVISIVATMDKDGESYEHTFSSLPAFIIVLRETLEATVLLAVLLQYLKRAQTEAVSQQTGNDESEAIKSKEAGASPAAAPVDMKLKFDQYTKQVYWGAAAGGLATTIFGAIILTLYYAAETVMPPRVAYIVEGVLLSFACIELTYFFITHLAPGMKSDSQWKKKHEMNLGALVEEAMKGGERRKFFWLTFSTVFREGFEAVVFITPFAPLAPPWALTMAGICGLVVGLVLGFTTFMGSKKMDLTKFFIAASVFFLFMSAGLAAHASYEFQKAGAFGTWACKFFNGTTISLDDDGAVGGDTEDAYRRILAEDLDDECYSKVHSGTGADVGDDYFAYRRQLTPSAYSDDDAFYQRSKSCDCDSKHEIAWVNVEVWDLSDCCDIGFEGSGLFFFILMILFWYRPQMSRLELIVMCLYWPIALSWGYYKISSIRAYNKALDEEGQALEMVPGLETYEVEFAEAKLGLNLTDKDGKVFISGVSGAALDAQVTEGSEVVELNGHSLAILKIRSHAGFARKLGKTSSRPLKMTLRRPATALAVPVAEASVVAGDETTAMVAKDEPSMATFSLF